MPKPEKTKKLIRVSALLAAVILIAVVSEFVYSAAESSRFDREYPADAYLSYEFTPHELLLIPGPDAERYETLANDSYFELTGLKGLSARSIDFHMSRDPNDTTEMVVRFSGKSAGVAGVFTAGIKRIEPGLYRTEADFDAIDSLRIYPTEKTGTTILFEGVKFNTVVEYPRFSVSRVFLWAALTAAVSRIVFVAVGRLKKRKDPLPRFSAYLCALALVALFAFLSTRLFWSARQLGDVLIPVSLAAFSVFCLFLWFISEKVKSFPGKAMLLFLFAGAAFTFATAPLQVPDEGIHFARSYAVASGSFGFDGGYRYPESVGLLYDVFSENLKMYELQHGEPSASARMLEYFSRLGAEYAGDNKAYSNVQLLLPYLPSAVGVSIARIFTDSALAALYLGRLFNVLMVAFAAYFALSRAARYITPLLVVIFSPLTVFMSASFSYDAMFLAALIVFLGIISAESITKRDFAILLLVFGVAMMIKPLYFPLALLLFAVPKGSFRFKGNFLALTGALVAAGVLCWQGALVYARFFASNIRPSELLIGVDKTAQLSFIVRNPLRFLAVTIVDGFRKSFYLGEFGLFGHLDLEAKLTGILTPALTAICFVLSAADPNAKRNKSGFVFLLFTALLYLAVSAGFYVAESGLGGSTILGIQARYFTPSLFSATALFGGFFAKYLRPNKIKGESGMLALWLCFAVALIASLEVFAGYYL